MTELDPVRDLPRFLLDLSIGKPRSHHIPKGGAKADLITISCDECWCGRPMDHEWVGREDGAPHPRYP